MTLLDFVRSLSEASKECILLVEGKRDKQALERLGVKNILTIGGIRLRDLPDILEGYSCVILLFDLDKHGERLTEKVKDILSREGYILIERFRDALKELGIMYVEELYEEVGCSKHTSFTGQADKVKLGHAGGTSERDKGRHRRRRDIG